LQHIQNIDFGLLKFICDLVFGTLEFSNKVVSMSTITRIAILFQIPILIGAVIFVNLPKGFFAVNSELGFSVLVLFLLVFFLFYGSGPFIG
jgi:hypothetical protein